MAASAIVAEIGEAAEADFSHFVVAYDKLCKVGSLEPRSRLLFGMAMV